MPPIIVELFLDGTTFFCWPLVSLATGLVVVADVGFADY